MLLTPDPECRMRDSALGSTDSGDGAAGAAVEDRRDPAGDAEAPGFVLAAGLAGGCFEGG